MTQQTLTPATGAGATRPRRRVLVLRFVRHYAEMVVAMVAGMGLLMPLVPGDGPYAGAVAMGLTMTAGMAFWMRYRRHSWRHVAEMSAAMLAPLPVLIPLAAAGAIGTGDLAMIEHVAMLPLMLLVMLRDPGAYTHPVQHRLRQHPRLRRAVRGAVVAAVAIALPIGYGFVQLRQATAESYEPAPTRSTAAPAPVTHDASLPTVAVVVGAQGAVAGDVLGPYETLAASGAFNTYVVAPEAGAVPLAGGLDLVPQLTFGELERRIGGAPEAIVVPAMPDAGELSNAPVRDWLIAQHERGSVIESVCAGAAVLASTGLLDGRAATSHWYRISGLAEEYPEVGWRRGVRYVDEGDVISTAGILSGVDGALRLAERFAGQDAARTAAAAIGWRHYSPGRSAEIPESGTTATDVVAPLNAGYRSRPTAAVELRDGVRELALSATFDVYDGQSFAYDTVTVGPRPVVSRHGLTFVPREPAVDADRTITPAAAGTAFPYDTALADLAGSADAPTARWTGKALEYHPDDLALSGPALSPWLVLRPVAAGLLVAALLLGLLRAAPLASLPRRRRAGKHQP